MTQLIFEGFFETEDAEKLISEIQNALDITKSSFRGRILNFDIENYAEFKEITNNEN